MVFKNKDAFFDEIYGGYTFFRLVIINLSILVNYNMDKR